MAVPPLSRLSTKRLKASVVFLAGVYVANALLSGASALLSRHSVRWVTEESGTTPEFPAWIVTCREAFGLREWDFDNQLARGVKTNPSKVLPSLAKGTSDWASQQIRGMPLLSPGFRIVRGGWPFTCVSCTVEFSAPEFGTVTGGVRIGRGTSRDDAVAPLMPAMAGIFANAAVYVLAAIACRRAWGWLTSLRRGRAGCCDSCGYSLEGLGRSYGQSEDESAVRCPECGAWGPAPQETE